MSNGKKLRKSKTDRKICGVCGGIAEYFGIDPIWIRLLWAIMVFVFGTGVVLYFVFALIMSDE
ncbi:MAG: PspC domain-containing protein [Clostridia bacterium]